MGQIADDTGRTPKSLYRVLARLERLGYVVRAGTYRSHGVDVGFIYSDLLRPKPKAVPGVPPVFVHEITTLEKHIQGQKEWVPIATLSDQQLENASDPVDVEVNLCSKERYYPDPGMDFSFPGGFQNANALRVVVTLDVANSNPMSNPFTARCISFPPPSCL